MRCPLCRFVGFQTGHLCLDVAVAWVVNYVVPMVFAMLTAVLLVPVWLTLLRWRVWG